MTTEEERRLAEELPRLIQEIRLRRGRRWLRDTGGRVWLRSVARRSAGTEGVPFELPTRRRKPKPARLLVLVDVSWSAARASGLFLALSMRLLRSRSRCRILAFVDRPVDVTDLVRPWAEGRADAPAEPPVAVPARRRRRPGLTPGLGIEPPWGGLSFRALLERTGGLDLDAASDFGRAFWSLAHDGGAIRKDTLVVVLGDGRSNRFDPQDWALEEISRRARGVIWLVPEPHGRWGTGDSALPEYFPWCDAIVETADLDGLVSGVREILRRL